MKSYHYKTKPDAAPPRQPNWLSDSPRKIRKNEAECLQLESQLQFMRLHGPPALTREEREAVQAEWRDKVKHRSTAYAYTATAASE
jgi:hypothetical protein